MNWVLIGAYILCFALALFGGVVGLVVSSGDAWGSAMAQTHIDFLTKSYVWIALGILAVLVVLMIVFNQYFSQHIAMLIFSGLITGVLLAFPLLGIVFFKLHKSSFNH